MNEQRRPRPEDIAATLAAGRATLISRRGWVIAAVLLAVTCVVLFLMIRPKAQSYTSEPVVRGPFMESVTATGTIEPSNTVEVGSQISGQIETVLVDYNDPVKVDDVLARIDTKELEARIKQTEAALLNARANLMEAEANAHDAKLRRERSAKLAAQGHVSRQDLDSADAVLARSDAAVIAAQAQIKSTEASLEIDNTNLSRAVIRAPINGVVLERSIDPGQTVAASFQTPVLFKLAEDLARMTLEADIDEADVGTVKAGQSAEFTVDAYPDRLFTATVRTIRFAPVTTNGVVTYKAILDAPNDDLALRPGMTATVEIVIARARDVLLIPSGALRFTPPGLAAKPSGQAADGALPTLEGVKLKKKETVPAQTDFGIIWVMKNGQPEPRAIRGGASDGIKTVVRAGKLEPGEAVITDVARESKSGGASS